MSDTKYILDTNVYIQAHIGYYHPDIVPTYWDLLESFGDKGIIESPKQVRDEISEENKWLSAWKKKSKIFLKDDLSGIMDSFYEVQAIYEKVKEDNIKILKKSYRFYKPEKDEPLSDSDIFVIANVLFYKNNFPGKKFVLVTKEIDKIHPYKSVRIPHICKELGIKCIDDFEFMKETGVKFKVIAPIL